MARSHANNGRIYRAVITRTFKDGSGTITKVVGPYDHKHVAQAQITSAVNQAEASHGEYRNPSCAHTATGHVESAEVIWMREAKG